MRYRNLALLLILAAGVVHGQGNGSPFAWLASQQRPDFSWRDGEEDETALVTLAFLGAGYTDRGAKRDNPYASHVRNAIRFLMHSQAPDGRFPGTARDHALATLALSEAYWMTRNPRYKAPAQIGVTALSKLQGQDGSWGDGEATLWAAFALKSATYAGLQVDPTAITKLKAWVAARPAPEKNEFDAAVQLAIRVIALAETPGQSVALKGLADRCLSRPVDPAAQRADERIYRYVATMALFHTGGGHWKQWNKSMKSIRPGKASVLEHSLDAMCLNVYYRYDRVFGVKGKNAAIGLGGGAGGAFRGRAGRRNLRAAGGSVRREFNTEGYDRIEDNGFRRVADHDTSTFSIDVDTASYANVRRFLLREGKLPPKGAVRIEELINYFDYGDPAPVPGAEHPLLATVETASCPWQREHRLARIALKTAALELRDRPATNLVFLLDVSGSMRSPDKLPLLVAAMNLLVAQLDARDRVAIVVYAGAAGLVLPSTPGDRKAEISEALGRLRAGGSTNGGAGIELAYRIARENFIEGGANRVILATDGDFNVGTSDRGSLVRMIEEKTKTGVFLSVLGFGTGNLKDAFMEELSNKGNGNYSYVDTLAEARKVLVRQLGGTLVTVAKDVKIQVFFNPARVAGYRLIGYENRLLKKEDFNDDKKDAGEIGAGHAVTALYELVPTGRPVPGPAAADENPFVERARAAAAAAGGPLFRLRVRYKRPDADKSTLLERDVTDNGGSFDSASESLRWSAAVASFGMLLRDNAHKGDASWPATLELAGSATGADPHGYRREFLDMVRKAKELQTKVQ